MKSQNTPGLEALGRDLEMQERVVVFWEYQRMMKMTQDYFSRSLPLMLDPVAFEDIPGGLQVQRQVTAELLHMALPRGGKPAWINRHTAEQLRSMSSGRSNVSYATWPQDVPLRDARDMEPGHLAAAYKWAMRWLAAQDAEAVVTRIARSRALTHTGSSQGNSMHWHQCMALRLLRGVVADGGASRPVISPSARYCIHHLWARYCISEVCYNVSYMRS